MESKINHKTTTNLCIYIVVHVVPDCSVRARAIYIAYCKAENDTKQRKTCALAAGWNTSRFYTCRDQLFTHPVVFFIYNKL